MSWPRIMVGALAFAAVAATSLAAQDRPRLSVERADGSSTTVAVSLDRGYAAVRLALLEDLGWSVSEDEGAIEVGVAGQIEIAMRLQSPFFRWDGVVLQMTDPPYRAGTQTYLPLQFVTDFLPRRLPGLYDFNGARSVLRAGDIELIGEAVEVFETTSDLDQTVAVSEVVEQESPTVSSPEPGSQEEVLNAGPSTYDGMRVVIIDAGHGGVDPGALGADGIREKTVALGIAMRMAALLEAEPGLEVHMIRDDDTFVDLWERGQIATELRGDRPGIFVSIHANSFPARREASGFETYFLSDARTEHERRVSAIENAPLSMGGEDVDTESLPDIDFILRDLTNFDHAHWSANLAGLVQDELHDFHPGPNRGVKQGVLAVLTNALMPSVLVEVGYLSNGDEARLLGRDSFHRDSAEALTEAVVRFFERYPPGSGGGGTQEER
jgi:N-acetylmuramoyl-L-alanine amidase